VGFLGVPQSLERKVASEGPLIPGFGLSVPLYDMGIFAQRPEKD